MFKRIAVALDASESAQQALKVALDLADEQGATLGVCSVVEAPFAGGSMPPGAGMNSVLREMQSCATATVKAALDEAHARGIPAVGETRYGSPAREFLRYAESFDAGAIVMGTHGRRGFGKMLMGSVAEGVLEKAFVPVILVRELRRPQCLVSPTKTEHGSVS